MKNEEYIEIQVPLNAETRNKLMSLTKKDLLDRAVAAALEAETFKLRLRTEQEETVRTNLEIGRQQEIIARLQSELATAKRMIKAAIGL